MKRWRKLKIVSRVQQREPLTLLSCFVRSDVNAGAAWQGVTVFLLHILLLLVRLAPSPSSNNLCVLLRCCRWRTIIYYNVNILIHARVRIFCTVYMCTFMIMGWQCCLIKIRWIRAIRKYTHTHTFSAWKNADTSNISLFKADTFSKMKKYGFWKWWFEIEQNGPRALARCIRLVCYVFAFG